MEYTIDEIAFIEELRELESPPGTPPGTPHITPPRTQSNKLPPHITPEQKKEID